VRFPAIQDWKDPDYEPVYRWRRWNLERLRAGGQDAWDAAWAYYASHPADAIDHWLTTYDPRRTGRGSAAFMPFVLFPRQRQAIEWFWARYQAQNEGVLDKSRNCGVTWLALAFSWWLWTFHGGVQIGFGSRTEGLVDRIGDPDSIFEKFRMLMRYLPAELKPLGFKADQDLPHMRLKNRENGSAIIGQGGRNIGRGGRSSIYFIDEAAFLEYPEDAEAALSETADCKVWMSTVGPEPGDYFSRKRWGGNFPVFTFHWRDDPRKDDAWYQQKKRSLEPEVLAREVDIDYEAGATMTAVSPAWVRASVALRQALESEVAFLTGAGEAGLDVAGGGANKTVFIPRYGCYVGEPKAWAEGDSINVGGLANEAAKQTGCEIIKFDSIGLGRGVAAALRRMPDVESQGVNAGDRPTLTRWPDGKRAKDKFANLKAELWWVVRDRLRRTYEHWLHYAGEGGQAHEVDDLLLLPDDAVLCAELALPRYTYLESGKIQIEGKRQLAKRGIASPDYADALILSFAPRRRVKRSRRTRGLL